jgi:hypothetical protein
MIDRPHHSDTYILGRSSPPPWPNGYLCRTQIIWAPSDLFLSCASEIGQNLVIRYVQRFSGTERRRLYALMNSINRAEQSCDVCWRLMGVANLRNCGRVLCGGDVANVDELWC